jgi:hypothetical protein
MSKSGKSGYARDIMPELLTQDERAGQTVPIADPTGAQAGVAPPAVRVYKPGVYKVVTLNELDSLTHKRTTGELPPIKDGLDPQPVTDTQPAVTKGQKRMPPPSKARNTVKVARTQPVTPDFDPLGEPAEPEPGSPELVAEEQQLQARFAQAAQVDAQYDASREYKATAPLPAINPMTTYLARRMRVTLELVDGFMTVSAIDVKQTKYGVTLLLPIQRDGAVFIPKPGSEITVVVGDSRWPCFFPGTYFESEELGIVGLTFVKAEG